MRDEILVFPGYEEKKQEVEKLRSQLTSLLLEQDDLVYVVCKNIEAKYMAKLGCLEYELYQKQCDVLRLKREMELIQSSINQDEAVDLKKIKEQLDQEFIEYEHRLNGMKKDMIHALQWLSGEVMTNEESKDFKKMYHTIVKALHPDMNPNASEEQTKLFEKAVAAYKKGDIDMMRLIYEMVIGNLFPPEGDGNQNQLDEEKKRLTTRIKEVQNQIKAIQSQYPYTMKDIIDDEEKVTKKREELQLALAGWKEKEEFYQARIRQITGQN